MFVWEKRKNLRNLKFDLYSLLHEMKRSLFSLETSIHLQQGKSPQQMSNKKKQYFFILTCLRMLLAHLTKPSSFKEKIPPELNNVMSSFHNYKKTFATTSQTYKGIPEYIENKLRNPSPTYKKLKITFQDIEADINRLSGIIRAMNVIPQQTSSTVSQQSQRVLQQTQQVLQRQKTRNRRQLQNRLYLLLDEILSFLQQQKQQQKQTTKIYIDNLLKNLMSDKNLPTPPTENLQQITTLFQDYKQLWTRLTKEYKDKTIDTYVEQLLTTYPRKMELEQFLVRKKNQQQL